MTVEIRGYRNELLGSIQERKAVSLTEYQNVNAKESAKKLVAETKEAVGWLVSRPVR
jgi:hypothetical protein